MTQCGDIVALAKKIYKPTKFQLIFVAHIQCIHQRMCCSFYQYLPMIKSGPSGYPNLTTSLLYVVVYGIYFWSQEEIAFFLTQEAAHHLVHFKFLISQSVHRSLNKHSSQMALVTDWARSSCTESMFLRSYPLLQLAFYRCCSLVVTWNQRLFFSFHLTKVLEHITLNFIGITKPRIWYTRYKAINLEQSSWFCLQSRVQW